MWRLKPTLTTSTANSWIDRCCCFSSSSLHLQRQRPHNQGIPSGQLSHRPAAHVFKGLPGGLTGLNVRAARAGRLVCAVGRNGRYWHITGRRSEIEFESDGGWDYLLVIVCFCSDADFVLQGGLEFVARASTLSDEEKLGRRRVAQSALHAESQLDDVASRTKSSSSPRTLPASETCIAGGAEECDQREATG